MTAGTAAGNERAGMETEGEEIADSGSDAGSRRRQALALLLFLLAGAALIGLPVLGALWVAPYLWPRGPEPWMPPSYDPNLRLALIPALFFMQTLVFPRMTLRLRLTVPLVLLATAAVQAAGLGAWWGCGLLIVSGILQARDSVLTFAAIGTAALAATGIAVHLLELAFARRAAGGGRDR